MLDIKNLVVRFKDDTKNAVNGVSLHIDDGEIFGLVGESGSGKTMTAMSVAGLLDLDRADCSGQIILDGVDLLSLSEEQMRDKRGKDIGVVFQEPMTSMNPVMRIGKQVEECLYIHEKGMTKAQRKAAALEAMASVDLREPELLYKKYPHELSGGMLQRIMIASAIISRPKILLADEPTTALDVLIQAQILDLLKRINKESGMSILFISHNLHVVQKLCTRIAVMQGGNVVETGSTEDIFNNPQTDYTKKLIAAIPTRDRKIV